MKKIVAASAFLLFASTANAACDKTEKVTAVWLPIMQTEGDTEAQVRLVAGSLLVAIACIYLARELAGLA